MQLAQLEDWIAGLPEPDREPLARLRALLVEDRRQARAEMLATFDSPRYARFVRRFAGILRNRLGVRTPAALALAPDLVERRHASLQRAARKIGPGAPPAAYHRQSGPQEVTSSFIRVAICGFSKLSCAMT